MQHTKRAFAAWWLALGVVIGCEGGGSNPPLDGGVGECDGMADGTPCGSDDESACDQADTCLAGECVTNHAAAGAACGDPTARDCDAPDACDGAGECQPNPAPEGAACGDPASGDCDGADTCNGSGACLPNYAGADTACGDPSATECDAPDRCDGAGACQPSHVPVDTACGDASVTDCDAADTCDGVGACQPNLVPVDTACGDASDTECDDPDTCDGAGACQPNYASVVTACGDATATDCDRADTCDGAGGCEANPAGDGEYCYDCAAGPGRCDVCYAASCGDGPGCPLTSTSLSTTFAAGNNHRGNMFDVTAINTVRITSFDASPRGNTDISVYVKAGTWVGYANDPGAWTLLGTAPVVATGGAVPVAVPIDVTIRAGETYAFYVTSTTSAVSLNYSDGTQVGAVQASDANVQFHEGGGMEYPFTLGTGTVYQPRVWNGVIHYVVPEALGTVADAHTGALADAAMFDLEAASDTEVWTLDVELEAGTFDVDVYFRRGTFVGAESSSEGWERIGGAAAIASAGGGALSAIPLDGPIFLSTGEVGALYVVTSGDALRVDEGGAVGDIAVTSGALSLEVGSAIDASFAGVGPASTIRAVLRHDTCE